MVTHGGWLLLLICNKQTHTQNGETGCSFSLREGKIMQHASLQGPFLCQLFLPFNTRAATWGLILRTRAHYQHKRPLRNRIPPYLRESADEAIKLFRLTFLCSLQRTVTAADEMDQNAPTLLQLSASGKKKGNGVLATEERLQRGLLRCTGGNCHAMCANNKKRQTFVSTPPPLSCAQTEVDYF